MATVMHWGGDLSDEELRDLSRVFGHDLSVAAIIKIKSAYLSYIGEAAVRDSSQPTKMLRQRLRSLAQAAREAAVGLGADGNFFDEAGAYYSKQRTSAPQGLPDEINSRVEIELLHLDIDFRRGHRIDLECGKIELMRVAWQLAQISRAAENAVAQLAREKRGRPESGAKRFVSSLLDALLEVQPDLTCSYDPVEGSYRGSFPAIAQWFRELPLGIRESEQTLCKFAAEDLARRNKHKKGATQAN
jgi:hypothetical protein